MTVKYLALIYFFGISKPLSFETGIAEPLSVRVNHTLMCKNRTKGAAFSKLAVNF